jgi:hypothetical protein
MSPRPHPPCCEVIERRRHQGFPAKLLKQELPYLVTENTTDKKVVDDLIVLQA